jgi:curved DNA-binding protein CbpA
VAEKDPYELLGVPRDASDERIRAAYELEINRATRDGAIRYAAELSAAYDTISSPQRRALYERHGFTAISQRSPGTAPPAGSWRSTQEHGPARRRKRRSGVRRFVLLIVVIGLVVAVFYAAQQAEGATVTAPTASVTSGPAVVQPAPDR